MNQIKKLRRSRTHRVMAGVCGGLGDYFNMDPVIIRVGLIALILMCGTGILFYLLMCLIVPLEPDVITVNQ